MKTTNYEISKQLAEAGFKSEHDFSWYKNESGKKLLNYGRCWTVTFQDSEERILDYYEFCFPAYVLETILEALPDLIRSPDSPPHLCNPLFVSKKGVGYDYASGMTSIRKEGESLANCAAKMWLKLKKEGLV